jgi:acetyltransferase-like isoleucine patch superfamily enzyme
MHSFNIFHYLRNKINVKKNNHVEIGSTLKMSGCTVTIKGNNNILRIGDNVRLRNTFIEIIGENCSIEIGNDCMVGNRCYLSAKENDIHIRIADDCGFSRNVKIMTSDGHPIFQNGERINPARDIVIHEHVWVADNVTILKGVTIGDGCVIGIHSLVTKSVPANSIAVGIPAKVVKSDIEWKA